MRSIFARIWNCRTPLAALAVGLLLPLGAASAVEIDFGDLSLPSESQWNGEDSTYDAGGGDYNSFVSRGATFNNYHDWYYDTWSQKESHYWDGWAYSNRTDVDSTATAGQYTAVADPVGGQGDANYGVAYFGFYGAVPTVTFDSPCTVESAYFTNNAYAYHSMLDGDAFARKFGWMDEDQDSVYEYEGDYPDWFKLTIIGKDVAGAESGRVDFFLADYTFADDAEDYIVADWTRVDLTPLGNNVGSLEFALSSSDVGDWGMNTPAYFAMDDLTVVPEPSALVLLCAGLLAVLVRRRRRT